LEDDLTNYFNHSSLYRGPLTLDRERPGTTYGTVSNIPITVFIGTKHINANADQGIPITGAGTAALNKSDKGEHVEDVESDPNDSTYVGIVEIFHQLHCLVGTSYVIVPETTVTIEVAPLITRP
jgi:hypothetical protein